jgi:regulator of sigma D
MKKELIQAWINILGIQPSKTVRLNAQQSIDIALEYERLLSLTYQTLKTK